VSSSRSASMEVPEQYFNDLHDSARKANGRPVTTVSGYPGLVGLPHLHLFNIAESDPAKKKTLTAPKDGFLQLDFLNGNPVRFRALFGDEPKRKKKRGEVDTGYRYVLFRERPSEDTKAAFQERTGTRLEPSNAQHIYSLIGPHMPEAKPMESDAPQPAAQGRIGSDGKLMAGDTKEKKPPKASGNWRVRVTDNQPTIGGALADAEAQPGSKRGREDAQPTPDADTSTPPPRSPESLGLDTLRGLVDPNLTRELADALPNDELSSVADEVRAVAGGVPPPPSPAQPPEPGGAGAPPVVRRTAATKLDFFEIGAL
jgi:hypothetical protein